MKDIAEMSVEELERATELARQREVINNELHALGETPTQPTVQTTAQRGFRATTALPTTGKIDKRSKAYRDSLVSGPVASFQARQQNGVRLTKYGKPDGRRGPSKAGIEAIRRAQLKRWALVKKLERQKARAKAAAKRPTAKAVVRTPRPTPSAVEVATAK